MEVLPLLAPVNKRRTQSPSWHGRKINKKKQNMSLCYSGMFKKEVKSTRSGADFIFYHFSRFREEAGCCRLDSFGGISFGGNSFLGGGGEGGVLTAKALWFPFQGTHWFPWQQRSPASKVLPGDQGLARDAPNNYPRPRPHRAARLGRELGGGGSGERCKYWAQCGPLRFPLHVCKQLLILRSLHPRA